MYLLGLALMLSGCEFTDGTIDGKSVKEEIKQRRIQRISEGELLEKALQTGRTIQNSVQTALQQNLKTAIEKGGVPYALAFCNVAAMPITDSLSKLYSAKVRRVSHRPRNKAHKPDSTESIYLDGYLYNVEQGLPLEENVQILRSTEEILYTAPITIASPMCLQCHGTPDKEVSKETLAQLQTLYPEDEATGFALNAFRGMWSIRMTRKSVVIALQPPDKKRRKE
jgi:hypothetical protein